MNIKLTHYSHQIGKEAYKQAVFKGIESVAPRLANYPSTPLTVRVLAANCPIQHRQVARQDLYNSLAVEGESS
jgi:hypothetical protein